MNSHIKSLSIALSAILLTAFAAHAQVLSVTNNLSLWLKAYLGVTTNASGVSLWADQSGNGNDATQSNPSREPQWVQNVLNGKPTVRLDGVNDFMALAAGSGGIAQSADSTIYIVYQVDPTGPGTMSLLSRGFTSGANIYTGLVGPNTRPGIYFNSFFEAPTNLTAWSYVRYGLNSSGPEEISVLGGTPTTAEISGTPTDWIALGSGLGVSQEYKGDFAEVLIYDTVLSGVDRQNVHEYLLAKYALPEPSAVVLASVAGLVLWRRRRN
jgi:hypothetical protein